MSDTKPVLKTLQEAIAYFSDPQRAFDYAVRFRWPDGKVTCPRCGSEKHSFIKTRRIWYLLSLQEAVHRQSEDDL